MKVVLILLASLANAQEPVMLLQAASRRELTVSNESVSEDNEAAAVVDAVNPNTWAKLPPVGIAERAGVDDLSRGQMLTMLKGAWRHLDLTNRQEIITRCMKTIRVGACGQLLSNTFDRMTSVDRLQMVKDIKEQQTADGQTSDGVGLDNTDRAVNAVDASSAELKAHFGTFSEATLRNWVIKYVEHIPMLAQIRIVYDHFARVAHDDLEAETILIFSKIRAHEANQIFAEMVSDGLRDLRTLSTFHISTTR